MKESDSFPLTEKQNVIFHCLYIYFTTNNVLNIWCNIILFTCDHRVASSFVNITFYDQIILELNFFFNQNTTHTLYTCVCWISIIYHFQNMHMPCMSCDLHVCLWSGVCVCPEMGVFILIIIIYLNAKFVAV